MDSEKQRHKLFFPLSASLLYSHLYLLHPKQHRGMANGGCGQPTTAPPCPSLPSSSHRSPAPPWPPQGLQGSLRSGACSPSRPPPALPRALPGLARTLLPHSRAGLCPSINVPSPRRRQPGRGAEPCPALGRLEPAVSGCVRMGRPRPRLTQAPAAPHQRLGM